MAAYAELVSANIQIVGTADHTVTHSLYLLDPDGNELELYVDISDAWRENPKLISEATKKLNLKNRL